MFWNFIQIGFEHVIPLGYDHILFIVALFFFNSHLKSAVIQCTLFTIAHSLTLALVTLEYVHVNTKWVEVVIALSIFVMAFENIFQPKLKSWRLVLIFFFGLIHGMGFAGSIRFMLASSQKIAVPLLGFNLGLEAGQVLVLMVILLMAAGLLKMGIRASYFTKGIAFLAIIAGLAMCISRYPL
jgi:hypothetical protein